MTPAQEKMTTLLTEIPILMPNVPVVSNVTASPTTDPNQIRKNLILQITGAVRWRESVMEMQSLGGQVFAEVGPGKVLTNLVKRTIKGVEQSAIGKTEEIYGFKDI